MKIKLLIFLVVLLTAGLIYTQSITIGSPNTNMNWEKGKSHRITWTTSGSVNAHVKIRLLKHSGVKVLNIAERVTTGNNEFSWFIPQTLNAGQYSIRVKAVDNSVSNDSPLFNITDPATPTPEPPSPEQGTINITNPPSPNSQWMHKKTYPIIWQTSGTISSSLKIDLMNSTGSLKITTIFPTVSNGGSKKWTPPLNISAGSYRIRISTLDNLVSDKSGPFKIIKNPKILYSSTGNMKTIAGPATPGRNIRRSSHLMTPTAKPKFLMIRINGTSPSHQMSTPLSSTGNPIKVNFTGICSSPLEYKVVILMSNIHLGGVLQHVYDSGWRNDGKFNIYIPPCKIDELESNPLPMWYGGDISLRLKNKVSGQVSSKSCIVKFTW